ncbi:hypothetical protein GSB9_03009 [Flavobacteriaceae bacterium GSB9]|nr:hypothetical protein GSB9_03009 [Flavobacteriaceae bacterium GSB9]
MQYYLILALQGYCVYHLITRKNPFWWFFIIMFIPVIGSIVYLITQVYNKRDAEKITNEVAHIINPTKKVKDLEKRLQFSETYQNRVDLADAYLEIKDYNNAVTHYLEALKDQSQNNFYAAKKLINAYFNLEDYQNVIHYAENIKGHPEFYKSRTQFLYGLSLEKMGNIGEAETHLRQIDIRYSFYEERLILAKFLMSIKKETEAKEILNEIFNESSHMTKPNRRLYRGTIAEVEKLLKEFD